MDSQLRVGLVGVGRMGSLMLGCLRRRGFEVTVYDPSEEAIEPYANDAAVTVTASPREVAERTDVVGVVVFDDAQVLDVLHGTDGLLSCSGAPPLILIHSTVTAETIRKAGSIVRAAGADLLDAAVSGGTSAQRDAGELCVMVGGDAAALERARPMLDAYAGMIVHAGPLGAGMDAKLVRNMASFSQVAVAHEALGLGRAMGLGVETIVRILDYSFVLSDNTRSILETSPERQLIDPEDPAAAQQVRYVGEVARKDLDAARLRAAELGRTLPLADASLDELARAFRTGQRPDSQVE